MAGFFISYQRKSKKFAKKLMQNLQIAGIRCWIDENIPLGEEWKQIIDIEIADSIGVIVVVTPDALKSQYVTYEWAYALGLDKKVIPLILEKPDPNNPDHLPMHPKLDDFQNRDFTNPKKQPWEQLIAELQGILQQDNIPQEILEAENALRSIDPNKRNDGKVFLLNHENHEAAIEAFARVVPNESPDISMNAALGLVKKTKYKDLRAIPGLKKGLHTRYVEDCLNALVNMNCPEAVKCLSDLFMELENKVKDTVLRTKLMSAMTQITHESAIPELKMMLLSRSPSAGEIVDALGRFRDPQALPELFNYLTRSYPKHDSVYLNWKVRTVRAIAAVGTPETPNQLFNVIKSMGKVDNQIVKAVIDALKTIGGSQAIEALDGLMSIQSFSVRQNVIQRARNDILSGSSGL
jgi:HEAT repeat protein